ncbi:hypothetical protein [Rhodococcus aetherivorans]|nr:membrane protein [Rhodococcus rhodochrous]
MPAIVQFAGIVILAAVGLMLLLVGAVGSGGICVVASGVWFWRLYRASEG